MGILTEAERDTLNAAMAIIVARIPLRASFSIGASNYHGTPSSDVTYFDTNNEQHIYTGAGKGIRGETFADQIECAFTIQQQADADRDGYRDRRREHLRKELAKLDEAA